MPGIKFSDKALSEVINYKWIKQAGNSTQSDNGWKKNPYLQLLKNQYKLYSIENKDNSENKGLNETNDEILLNELLKKLNTLAEEHGVKLILTCPPGIKLHEDGTLSLIMNEPLLNQFKRLCNDNNIYFLDMGDRIMQEYQNHHILPRGFINTSVGSGHLNKYGHAMLAEELFKLIKTIEE